MRESFIKLYFPLFFVGVLTFGGVYFIASAIRDNNEEILTNRAAGKVTQTYTRTMVCISSVSPTLRVPAYVKECYAKAEATTGQKVEHYGDGI